MILKCLPFLRIKGKLKGVSQITDSVHIEEEKTNFEQIWNRILMNLESVYDFSFSLVGKFSGEKAEITRKIENISELLRKKIDLIFQSESYKYSRMEQNLRVYFFNPLINLLKYYQGITKFFFS